MFVRVKDLQTGHEFDVPEGSELIGVAYRLVRKPAYPPSEFPRRTKHAVRKGRPVGRSKTSSARNRVDEPTERKG
jgi:hypothetical protein